jgi:hypothetical protein
MSNMQAELLMDERRELGLGHFVELRVWKVPKPVRGSGHAFKYRLAYVVHGKCVLRYDNEAGKGDHKHIGGVEKPYRFSTPARLYDDFMADVENWRVR